MCGICGYAGPVPDGGLLRRMTDAITHRGPDDEGLYLNGPVGLGMRRLSIIDVASGRQPIQNEDGSLTIVFNGEIYNYKALREDLIKKGHRFTTRSDTETILHLYEEHGPGCVHRLRGMFAFAIHDGNKKSLFIARDRLGVKPLYYWFNSGRLIFGSEIKSILESKDVKREPDLASVDAYLTLRYVPGPDTIFSGIRKLPAAHWLIWDGRDISIERYWTPEFHSGPYQPDGYYREKFGELFTESVKLRLMSEVPLGAYLSGGLDSSAITAAMSRMSERPVKTFSVGFDWHGDELPAAKAVAQRLGCDHHEIICGEKDFENLPKIIWNLDEPLGDAIIVPMFLLSRLAREHVTVVLSGEGADETLAGYLFHKVMVLARRYADFIPRAVRKGVIERSIRGMPAFLLNMAFDYPGTLGNRGRRKILDYLSLAGAGSPDEEYHFLISLFDAWDKKALYAPKMLPFLDRGIRGGAPDYDKNAPYLNRILSLQYDRWLPDDILMKQDKISMANSIEARVPFLDHVLVEFLLAAPPHLKLSGLKNKVLLREYLKKVLPGDISRRKKKAFYIPIEKYLENGPLKDITEVCLSEESVRRRGYLDWEYVRELRRSVRNGEFLFGKQVFSLVALELWHRIYIDKEAGWV